MRLARLVLYKLHSVANGRKPQRTERYQPSPDQGFTCFSRRFWLQQPSRLLQSVQRMRASSAAVPLLRRSGSPTARPARSRWAQPSASVFRWSRVQPVISLWSTAVTTLALTATDGTNVGFNAAWGTFSGTVASATQEGPTTARVIKVTASGTFSPLAGPPDLSGFDAGPMVLTFTANQPGEGGAVSANYSISSTPASAPVPEPGSMALTLALTKWSNWH